MVQQQLNPATSEPPEQSPLPVHGPGPTLPSGHLLADLVGGRAAGHPVEVEGDRGRRLQGVSVEPVGHPGLGSTDQNITGR